MAVIKEIIEGNCRVYLYDEYAIKNEEEKREIIDNASAIMIEALGRVLEKSE